MSSLVNADEIDFDAILSALLKLPPPLLPPGKASEPKLTDQISSLYVHPCLEAALHILNSDLPSAHFLCRHMQAKPQYEGMFLHGILHRVEGDYDNARAWYRDVSATDVFNHVWPKPKEAFEFIDQVETFKGSRSDMNSRKRKLEQTSVAEITGVIRFCVDKFGTKKIQDATKYWQQPDGELSELGKDMVTGSKGFRRFEG